MKQGIFVLSIVAIMFFSAAANAYEATNPFMDVPLNHWAYDAIAQLNSKGVFSGYPDGTYKGNQPLTRYEAASAIARTLASVDMTKADKQDVEMLKRLVVEFNDELSLLGVKVSELDSRIAVLENNLGGWKLRGEFRMNARFAEENGGLYTSNSKSDFDIDRVRIWLEKQVDDKTRFTTRLGKKNSFDTSTGEQVDKVLVDLAWIDVAFPWDISAKIGKWEIDWSAEDNTYSDNDSMFSDRTLKGFYFSKPWSQGSLAAYISREDSEFPGLVDDETLEYGVRGKVNFGEDIFLSGNYIKRHYDGEAPDPELDESILWGTFGATFTPGFDGRFSYYSQKLDSNVPSVGYSTEGDSNAWHLMFVADQSRLKFTSFTVEYIKPSENFRVWTDGPFDAFGARVTGLELGRYDDILFLKAEQKWSDKWTTFERYLTGSARWDSMPDGSLTDNTTNWSVGVRYWYTPSLSFELAYDKIQNSETLQDNNDSMVRLRTYVTF